MDSIYKQRIDRLREKKIQQTEEKLEYEGFLDEDDYGRVVPTFEWHIIPNADDGNFYGASGWAENFYDLMTHHDIYDDPDDTMSGRWMYFMSKMRPSSFPEEKIPSSLRKKIDYYGIDAGIGLDAHFCPDYRIGLKLGWNGLLEKIDEYDTGENPSFYEAHRKVIRGVQNWILRHISYYREKVSETEDESLRKIYSDKLAVNEAVLSDPPSTYREALQWIIWFHLASRTFNRDGAGGQLDSLLMPYYERDLSAGRIDRESAVYFMACFLINDPVYWQIGGVDEKGNDLTSEMSWIILDAAELADTTLNLTLRVHDKMDEKLFDRAVRLLVSHKKGWLRFSGDNALVNGFERLGYSKELGRERIAVGCNWMALPGCEYTVNDLYKVNFARVFELAWNDTMREAGYPSLGGDIKTYVPVVKGTKLKPKIAPSVSLLLSLYEKRLKEAVDVAVAAIEFHLASQKDNEVELMLNLLCYGPLEKGKDISDGGAMYYNLALDGAGLGTVSDAFAAIEQRVEEEKRLSWKELNGFISTNWDGIEGDKARRMMKASRRYGASKRGNEWGVMLSRMFSEYVVSKRSGSHVYIPGLFSWAKPHIFGKAVGATPDGRRYGDPISMGANPSSDTFSDAAALAYSNAIAMVQPGFGNTAPYQMEFDPFLSGGDPVETVKAIIKGHFALGGTLMNINIVDKDKILDADRHPEKYPDLVVRVTGFTAYFIMLTPEFRRLVVHRVMSKI